MRMLYIVTHTCGTGGYSPVVFDDIYTAVSYILNKVKETLKYAISIDALNFTSITVEYVDDSFDEYRVYQIQQDMFKVDTIPFLEKVYNLKGVQQICKALTTFPSLIGTETLSSLISYLDYLHQWSIDHKDEAFNGMIPAEYDEWRVNELVDNIHE